jgi:hypothetical protein
MSFLPHNTQPLPFTAANFPPVLDRTSSSAPSLTASTFFPGLDSSLDATLQSPTSSIPSLETTQNTFTNSDLAVMQNLNLLNFSSVNSSLDSVTNTLINHQLDHSVPPLELDMSPLTEAEARQVQADLEAFQYHYGNLSTLG